MRGFGSGRLRAPGEGLKAFGTAVLAAALSVAATLWVTPAEPPGQASAPAPGMATAECAGAIQCALAQRSEAGMRVVRQLCAPDYAGRKAGTPGADRAAVDRLVMVLTDTDSIRDVILFPQMKPEG